MCLTDHLYLVYLSIFSIFEFIILNFYIDPGSSYILQFISSIYYYMKKIFDLINKIKEPNYLPQVVSYVTNKFEFRKMTVRMGRVLILLPIFKKEQYK